MSGSRQRVRRFPDLSAMLIVALAGPLAALYRSVVGADTSAGEIRDEVTRDLRTAEDVSSDILNRLLTWFALGAVSFVLVIGAIELERLLTVPISPWFTAVMAFCWLAGLLHTLRFGRAWYLTDAKWRRAGTLLRFLVTPGNVDLVVAATLVGGVALLVYWDW